MSLHLTKKTKITLLHKFIHDKVVSKKKTPMEDKELVLMRKFDDYISQGKINEGILTIKEILRTSPNSIPMNILLHSLLVQSERWSMLAQHTKIFLPLLMKLEQYDVAAEVYLVAYRLNKNCKPNDPECYHRLANELRKNNHSKTAISLLKDFHKKFAQHSSEVAKNYLLVAKIYAEDLKDDERAKRVLCFINREWPSSQWSKKAKTYYRVMTENIHSQLLNPISRFV